MTFKELGERRAGLDAELSVILDDPDPNDDDLDRAEEITGTELPELDRREALLLKATKARERLAQSSGRAVPPEGGETRLEVGDDLEADRPFRSLGEQLMAVRRAAEPDGDGIDKRLLAIRAASGASESVPSDGGFLVQTDFVAELFRRAYETGVLIPRCTQRPISTNANGMKMNAIDETSRADGSRYGGVRMYWTDEAEEKTKSKPKYRQLELTLNKLTGLYYATDEALQDIAFLESDVTDMFAKEAGFKIDDAIINGTGAGQPMGILNAACRVSVAKETGQAATTIVAENIEKMYSRMWALGLYNAAWFINQDVWPQLFQLHHAVGTGGVPVFVPANGLSQAPFGTILGRPVLPIEQCQTLGTVGDIILADFSEYILINKGGLQAASSIHVRFIYDETTFRFVYRVDGQPRWKSALTPFKGANTQSPFVVLATRA